MGAQYSGSCENRLCHHGRSRDQGGSSWDSGIRAVAIGTNKGEYLNAKYSIFDSYYPFTQLLLIRMTTSEDYKRAYMTLVNLMSSGYPR